MHQGHAEALEHPDRIEERGEGELAVLTALSFTVFTALVKNIKAKKLANVKGLEALGEDD